MLIALLLIGTVVLAWANGANDNFKAVATLYGSGTLDYKQSLRVATGAQVAGSLASVVLAGALVKAFGGKGLVPDAVVGDPGFVLSVATGSAATVLIATRVGIPVSTTHAIVGALVGAGLWFDPSQLAWERLGATFVGPLLVSPLLALGAAAALYPLATAARRRFTSDGRAALAGAEALDRLHVASGLSLGFARGLNDTPKVLGLVAAAGWTGVHPRVALVAIATAMAVGGVVQARRVAETLGHRITTMSRGQGLLANLTGSALVIGASLLGMPVSTTHVSTGAIFGIGLHTGTADWRVVGAIVAAWGLTLPLSAAFAALAAAFLSP